MLQLVFAFTLFAFATAGDCELNYHGSCRGNPAATTIQDKVDEATCLISAMHVRNYCYPTRDTHGNGAVTTTWVANGASNTFTANDGCELDFGGSCPNDSTQQNRIAWDTADEATCLARAKWHTHNCYKTQADGNGAVTANWLPNGAVVASSTFAAINGCDIDYHGSCPYNGATETYLDWDVADEAKCLAKSQHLANYCYRTLGHGNGAVTTTWVANGIVGATSTFSANNGCELDYHGSCPNAPTQQNRIQWGLADEATCLAKAKWWATHCYKTQAHGNGAVTASWMPNGAVVASSTFAAINGCEIDYHGSCPYNGATGKHLDWDVADEAKCLAKSQHVANYCHQNGNGTGTVTTTWIVNGAVLATQTFPTPCTVSCALTPITVDGSVHNLVKVTHDTTSGHTHHECYATNSICGCKCCDDSDGTTDCTLPSNFQ